MMRFPDIYFESNNSVNFERSYYKISEIFNKVFEFHLKLMKNTQFLVEVRCPRAVFITKAPNPKP